MKFAKPLAALFLLLSLFSGSPAFAQSDETCDVFYAGQTIEVGYVCVTADANEVTLEYILENGWTLSEAHAWIGDNMATMPQNKKGNPQNGRFPHSASNLGGVTSHIFTIPVSQLNVNAETFCEAEIFVAAHGVVSKASGDKKGGGTESAWAGSTQLSSGGNWSRVFSVTNDFCGGGGDPDPEHPVVPLAAGCFNVFGHGDAVTVPYSPVGVTGTNSAWINSFSSSTYIGGDLISGSGDAGDLLAGVSGSNLAVQFSVDLTANPALIVDSANVYVGSAGSFDVVSPLQFGNPIAGNETGILYAEIPLSSVPADLDVVMHAVFCIDPLH